MHAMALRQETGRIIRYWLGGVRLYIGIGAVIVTLFVWWLAVAMYDSTLATIRLQEIFGWLSIGLIVITLLIGPTMKLFRNFPGRPLVYDARRALGISAAWFALLHAIIVYFVQLRAGNPLELPVVYRQSILLGAVALVCLLLLAATSVNRLMRRWGVWWFRLHRLIYLAIILAVLHSFMIGAHASSLVVLLLLAAVSLVWISLHGYIALAQPTGKSLRFGTLCISLCVLVLVLGYGSSQYLAQKAEASHAAEHNH